MAVCVGSFPVQGEAEGDVQVNTGETALLNFRNGVFTLAESCFPAETPVAMAKGGERPIGDVLPGDLVASFDPFGNARAARVEKVQKHEGNTDVVVIAFEGGALAATPEHPIWSDELGFTKAVNIRAGMHVRGGDGTARKVFEARSERRESHAVFNLSLDRASTRVYVAGGVLVHNK